MSIDNRKPYSDTLYTEFTFPSRGRISKRPDTNRYWFLSVCHRQAGAGRADCNYNLNI